MRRLGVVVALAMSLTACSGTAKTQVGSDDPVPTSASTGARKTLTASGVLDGLKAAVPTITRMMVYTAENDPNSKLGRPGQYTSKAGFHDSRVPASEVEFESEPFAVRRGGDIEVFQDEGGAKERADYIGGIVNKAGGIPGIRPEYIYRRGKVLLRVSGALTPQLAGEYERALASVVG